MLLGVFDGVVGSNVSAPSERRLVRLGDFWIEVVIEALVMEKKLELAALRNGVGRARRNLCDAGSVVIGIGS